MYVCIPQKYLKHKHSKNSACIRSPLSNDGTELKKDMVLITLVSVIQ